jgi:(p)ppGpp synthase/HD superfamily hydrolase
MYDYRPADIPAELTIILASLPSDDAERLAGAFQFAAAAHDGQVRDEGSPYIEHPVAVASILWTELGCRDVDVVSAALNHDVLEDCDWLNSEILSAAIGERATLFVEHVTKIRVPCDERAARDRDYLDRLRALPAEARLLKLADRIHNLRSVINAGDVNKAARYLDVSRREFYPLALMTDATAARLVAAACDDIEVYLQRQGTPT